MAKLRLAVITDIHYGPDIANKLGTKAPRLLTKFAKAVNTYSPDLVVDMGDRISARKHDDDHAFARSVKDHFNEVAAPVVSMIGNHDLYCLTRDENAAITGSPGTSHSMDKGGYHLVFWNPNVKAKTKPSQGLWVEKEELEWLRQDLTKTKKPTIIFSHVPLDNYRNDNKKDTKKWGGIANRFFYPEGPEIREIIERSGNVILCMAGHRHTNRHRVIRGIHYVTQNSLTQTYRKKYRIPTGSFSFIDLEDRKISIKMEGKSVPHKWRPKLVLNGS